MDAARQAVKAALHARRTDLAGLVDEGVPGITRRTALILTQLAAIDQKPWPALTSQDGLRTTNGLINLRGQLPALQAYVDARIAAWTAQYAALTALGPNATLAQWETFVAADVLRSTGP